MTLPPPRARRIPAATALFSTLFLTYRLFPDALHNFDGLMFSGIISERAPGWKRELLSYGAHFLFDPLAWSVHQLFSFLSPGISGAVSIQIMNAALGAGAVLLLAGLGIRVVRSAAVALPLALLAAHGCLFWGRAAECSVYMPALFAETLLFRALWEHHRRPSAKAAAILGAAAGLTLLFHLSFVFCCPAVLLFVFMRDRRFAPVFLAAVFAVGAAPQILAFRVFSVESLLHWYRHMGNASVSVWGFTQGSYWTGKASLAHHPAALLQLLWAWPPEEARWGSLAALLAAFAGLAGAAVRLGGRIKKSALAPHTPVLAFLAAHAAGVILLQTVWTFEITKYAWLVPGAFLTAALLARAARARRDKTLIACLWLLWAGTFTYNLQAYAVPRARFDRNEEYLTSLWVARVTPPGSLVVTSGLTLPMSKLYLTGLLGRGLLPMADVFIAGPRGAALPRIENLLREGIGRGTPVYVLSETLDDAVLVSMPPEWGVSGRDVKSLFRRFALQEVSRRDPSLAVFRLWPRGAPKGYWREAAAAARAAGRRREAEWALRFSDGK